MVAGGSMIADAAQAGQRPVLENSGSGNSHRERTTCRAAEVLSMLWLSWPFRHDTKTSAQGAEFFREGPELTGAKCRCLLL